jgi:hypothetical protein
LEFGVGLAKLTVSGLPTFCLRVTPLNERQTPNTKLTHMKPIACLTILLLACTTLHAQDTHIWPVKIQKEYSKSYPVGTDSIALKNRYGKMVIETWDKNEVRVDANISVSAETNEHASKLLERINITDSKNAGIEFRTEFGDKNNNWYDDNGGHEMRVDWIVHIPANAKLHAQNHFGPLTIGDYKGEAQLMCRYGTLTAGKISNSTLVSVEYGKAVIESITDSKIFFRYSRVDIGKLAGTVKGEMMYCNSVDLPIDNALKVLDLKNNYTSMYLMIPRDISADYDITTMNARLSSKNDIVIKEEQKEQPTLRQVSYTSTHHYTGSLGKGGATKINIRSNFGNIRIL